MEGKEKKKGGNGGKIAGAALILALLGSGGYFGLGIGNPSGGMIPGFNTPPETTAAVKETTVAATADPEAEKTIRITVKEDKLLYNGKEMDIKAIQETILKDYGQEKKVVLVDDHGVKAVYDSLTTLLNQLNIPFNKE